MHMRSLIRVFADRISLLQSPGYPKGDKQVPLEYWVDVQARGGWGGVGVTSYIWHSMDVRAEWPPFSALPGI